jgi:hypothetical protein
MRVLVVTIEKPVSRLPDVVLHRHVRAACRQRRTRGVTDGIGTQHNLAGGQLDTHDVILRRYVGIWSAQIERVLAAST